MKWVWHLNLFSRQGLTKFLCLWPWPLLSSSSKYMSIDLCPSSLESVEWQHKLFSDKYPWKLCGDGLRFNFLRHLNLQSDTTPYKTRSSTWHDEQCKKCKYTGHKSKSKTRTRYDFKHNLFGTQTKFGNLQHPPTLLNETNRRWIRRTAAELQRSKPREGWITLGYHVVHLMDSLRWTMVDPSRTGKTRVRCLSNCAMGPGIIYWKKAPCPWE